MTDTKVTRAEKFVFNAEQLTALHSKVSSSRQSHRLSTRRAIKRFSHGRAPVDNDWFAIRVGDCNSPDVKTFENFGRFG